MSLVHIVEGGERAQMSKRSGDFVSLDELLDDIGVDATRWFMLWRSHDTTVDLDLELARSQSSENPVYYVQYAHARIASILRKAGAAASGRRRPEPPTPGAPLEPSERALVKRLLEFPEEVREAAARRAPHRICAYSTAVAADFHAFYRDCQVVGAEGEGVERSRLALCLLHEADDRRARSGCSGSPPRSGCDARWRASSPSGRDLRPGPRCGPGRCAAATSRRFGATAGGAGGRRRRAGHRRRASWPAGGRPGRRRQRRRAAHGAARVRPRRGPRLADALGLAPAPGLHEYLRWEAEAPEILQPLVLAGPGLGGATRRRWSASSPARPAPDGGDAARLRRASATRSRSCATPTSWSSSTARRSATSAARCEAVAPEADALARLRRPRARQGRAGRELRSRTAGACRPRRRGAVVVGATGLAQSLEVVAGEVGVEALGVLAAGPAAAGRSRRRSVAAAAPPAQHADGQRHRGDEEGDHRHEVGGEVEARALRQRQHLAAVLGDQRVLDLGLGLARPRPARATKAFSRWACGDSASSSRVPQIGHITSSSMSVSARPEARRRGEGGQRQRGQRAPQGERRAQARLTSGLRRSAATLLVEDAARRPGRARSGASLPRGSTRKFSGTPVVPKACAALVADRAQLRVARRRIRATKASASSLLSWTSMPSTVTPRPPWLRLEALQRPAPPARQGMHQEAQRLTSTHRRGSRRSSPVPLAAEHGAARRSGTGSPTAISAEPLLSRPKASRPIDGAARRGRRGRRERSRAAKVRPARSGRPRP